VIGTDLAFEGVSSIYSDFMVLANNADDFVQNINNQIFSKIEKNEFKSFFRSTYFNHSIAEYIKI